MLWIIWKPQLRVNNMGVIKPLTQHRHKIILHNCQNIPARHAGPHKSWHYVKEGLLHILMLNISTQDSRQRQDPDMTDIFWFCGAERASLHHYRTLPRALALHHSPLHCKQAKRSIYIKQKLLAICLKASAKKKKKKRKKWTIYAHCWLSTLFFSCSTNYFINRMLPVSERWQLLQNANYSSHYIVRKNDFTRLSLSSHFTKLSQLILFLFIHYAMFGRTVLSLFDNQKTGTWWQNYYKYSIWPQGCILQREMQMFQPREHYFGSTYRSVHHSQWSAWLNTFVGVASANKDCHTAPPILPHILKPLA